MEEHRFEDRRRHSKSKQHKEREPSAKPPADSPLQASSSKPTAVHSAIIKLNIGGHHFVTTSSTLLSAGESYFSSMLSGRVPTTKDEAGEYFIDRDGEFFGPILTYLRSRELRVPSGVSKADILREAKFFLIGGLVDLLEPQAEQLAERQHGEDLNRSYPFEDFLPSARMIKQYVQQYWTQNEAIIFRFMDECAARGETKVLFSFTLVPNDASVVASKELEGPLLSFQMKHQGDLVQQYIRLQFRRKGFKTDGRCVFWGPLALPLS